MKNYPGEIHTASGGYRGAATAQSFQTSNKFQKSSSESYYPPFEEGYQQQEQFYDSQQHYGGQQQDFASLAGHTSLYEKDSPDTRVSRVGWLCYLGGWVTGLIFLLLKRERRFVRFHAIQSLIFFGVMSIATAIFNSFPFFDSIAAGLGFVSFICWIVLMVKAARGRYYKLPIIGDYAEKWANALRD
jgi:uncharacterized membrane protein